MKRSLLVVMCLVCAVFVAGPASAAILSLDYLIGTVVPASPANPADELTYANNLINFYNGGDDPSNFDAGPPATGYLYTLDAGSEVPDPDLALATGGVQFESLPQSLSGYTYLWAKFGDQGALYYLDSLTSIDGFDPAFGPFSKEGGGLSHITLFGPGTTRVPEAGALLMFGSGLIGLVAYRRMRRMQ